MTHKIEQPYGSWQSPITSSLLTANTIQLVTVCIDAGELYWNETRLAENGRSVIMHEQTHDKTSECIPAPYQARTRVHEYGGSSFTVHNRTVYFTNLDDQQFYSLTPEGILTRLSQADNCRYAEPVFDSMNKVIYAVEEAHASEQQIDNRLVRIDITGKTPVQMLYSGNDFYASITISPDFSKMAFITWNHPLMPWDGTELLVADLLPGGVIGATQKIAGGNRESVFQPRFAPDGKLFFASDRSGFWNLYVWDKNDIQPLYETPAEFGAAQWQLGMSLYDFIPNATGYNVLCRYTIKGSSRLAVLDIKKHKLEDLPLFFTSYKEIHVANHKAYFIAASPTESSKLYEYDLSTKTLRVIRKTTPLMIDNDYISEPVTLEYPTSNERTAFAFYYPPKNKQLKGPALEKPPLIVQGHGGPSSHSEPVLNLFIQFWTSRGFAFMDVNYGGSTGYGRAYRERLKGQWGVVDVDDCINAALHLVNKGLADSDRLVIKGSSAGGFTALAALTFHDTFTVGTSYYGVSDLIALAKDTHKFESHYLDGLIGQFPQQKARYIQYSPIYHVDKLSCPVILFQGEEDKVVPKEQSGAMFDALEKKNIPTAYLLFSGEYHGFRNAFNIKKALDSELYFYSQIFHFCPADTLDAIAIKNWQTRK